MSSLSCENTAWDALDGPLPFGWNSETLNGQKLIFLPAAFAFQIDAPDDIRVGQKKRAWCMLWDQGGDEDDANSQSEATKRLRLDEKGASVRVPSPLLASSSTSASVCSKTTSASTSPIGETTSESKSNATAALVLPLTANDENVLWVNPPKLIKSSGWFRNAFQCNKAVSVSVGPMTGKAGRALIRLIKYAYGWRPPKGSLSTVDVAWMVNQSIRFDFEFRDTREFRKCLEIAARDDDDVRFYRLKPDDIDCFYETIKRLKEGVDGDDDKTETLLYVLLKNIKHDTMVFKSNVMLPYKLMFLCLSVCDATVADADECKTRDYELAAVYLLVWHQSAPHTHTITDELFQLIAWQYLRPSFYSDFFSILQRSLASAAQKAAIGVAMTFACGNSKHALNATEMVHHPLLSIREVNDDEFEKMGTTRFDTQFNFYPDSRRFSFSCYDGAYRIDLSATIDETYFTVSLSFDTDLKHDSIRDSIQFAGRFVDVSVYGHDANGIGGAKRRFPPPYVAPSELKNAKRGDYVALKELEDQGVDHVAQSSVCRLLRPVSDSESHVCLQHCDKDRKKEEGDAMWVERGRIECLSDATAATFHTKSNSARFPLFYPAGQPMVVVRVRLADLVKDNVWHCVPLDTDMYKIVSVGDLLTQSWYISVTFDLFVS